MLKASIENLMQGKNLDAMTCEKVMSALLSGKESASQIAAFLVLLRAKGETSQELLSMRQVLMKKMQTVSVPCRTLDIVGTGGDGAHTINISTGSAMLAASCGVKIAKHGNRASSSLSGSADILEALGVRIYLSPESIAASIEKIGIGFYFAPNFNPAMRELSVVRRALNVPTTLNILGPLLNPVNPKHLLLGVYHESLLTVMAETLQKMGTEKSMIVHGAGIDEMSCVGLIQIMEVTPSHIQTSVLDPEALGLSRGHVSDLKGGDAKTNAKILLSIFSGERHPLVTRVMIDTLILNAAVALYLYGIHTSIVNGISHARENLSNGMALKLLKKWQEFSHEQ